MPIVKQYQCETCGWELEKWHVENEKQVPPLCPSCMKPAKQVITAPGIVLKGLGWSRDGHSMDIDDAEEFWKKNGEPVGKHVGKPL